MMEIRQTKVFKKDTETNYTKKKIILNNKEFVDLVGLSSSHVS